METVYIETTFISYLVSRPSRDLLVAAHQQITRDWWLEPRQTFESYVPQVVLDEVSAGDPEEAKTRMAMIGSFPVLEITEEAESLAAAIIASGAIPPHAVRFWRLPKQQYLRQKGEVNKQAMRALVLGGAVPGLLAYAGEEPIGWCAVAPRESYPALDRSRSRKALDDQPVWSITCVYVARSHRRQHLSRTLIAAALRHVRSQGGRIVEAYPVPAKPGVRSTNYAYTRFVSAFEAVGFSLHVRRSETRPVMRYFVRQPHKAAQPRSRTQGSAASRRSTRAPRG